MKLSHYSPTPIEAIHDGDPAGRGGVYKPKGLWISIDGEDDWPAWCSGEGWSCDENLFHYRIHLAPNHNLLILSTAGAVRKFSADFGGGYDQIDWPLVANKHDGVIIAPYQWDCRFDDQTNWYSSWDCASGVIWKAGAIASIELIGETTFVARSYDEEAAA